MKGNGGETRDEAREKRGVGPPSLATRNVLVTNADSPMGRRVVQRLFRQQNIGDLIAIGKGTPPRSFDALLDHSGGRLTYTCLDLVGEKSAEHLCEIEAAARNPIDTVIHIPIHGQSLGSTEDRELGARLPASLTPLVPRFVREALRETDSEGDKRTAEARWVLDHSIRSASIRHLIAVGSAYVYRLAPGNANRLFETSELDLDPAASDLRSWVDCDILFQTEAHRSRLDVSILRIPTIVTSDGALLLNPFFDDQPFPALRCLGFDPLCPLISDHDAVHAIVLAVSTQQPGIFNVAGEESVPLSSLTRWTGRASVAAPETLLRTAARGAELALGEGHRPSFDSPHLRYGFTLDTARARQALGFQPAYRIGPNPNAPGGLQLQASPS